jgi:hypothetical protein
VFEANVFIDEVKVDSLAEWWNSIESITLLVAL